MNRKLRLYYVLSIVGVLFVGAYPLYMGARVIVDMARYNAVSAENYPKYLIPYTPIAIAVLVGILLFPLLKRRQWLASGAAVAVFFAMETLFENLVLITDNAQTTLESWQMYMCYVPAAGISILRTPVEILIGDYSPWFKLHFYVIAVMLILAFVNILYGFGKVVAGGDSSRVKPLVIQSAATGAFLGMCILACFTAFYRTGELLVSPLSACLMIAFFVLLGLVAGLYAGSFLYGKRPLLSIVIPSVTASAAALLMYIGELCLLDGHLYQLGTGAFFTAVGFVPFAPVDILVVIVSGVLCGVVLRLISPKKTVA